jgi:hypothetical protein
VRGGGADLSHRPQLSIRQRSITYQLQLLEAPSVRLTTHKLPDGTN